MFKQRLTLSSAKNTKTRLRVRFNVLQLYAHTYSFDARTTGCEGQEAPSGQQYGRGLWHAARLPARRGVGTTATTRCGAVGLSSSRSRVALALDPTAGNICLGCMGTCRAFGRWCRSAATHDPRTATLSRNSPGEVEVVRPKEFALWREAPGMQQQLGSTFVP